MRQLTGDGFNGRDYVEISKEEVFNNVTLSAGPGTEVVSAQELFIDTQLEPTLIIQWTPAGSVNFDIYLRVMDVSGSTGVRLVDVECATTLTSASLTDIGLIVSLREEGSSVDYIYGFCSIVIKNNDVNALAGITAKVIQKAEKV